MRKIVMICFALISISSFGQVGIGTEDPQAALDVDPKGVKVEQEEDKYIRIEGLERKPDYLRKIVLDDKGNMATMDYDSDNFNLKTLKYVKSKKTIYTAKSANVMDNSKEKLSLELDLEVILSPYTDNILFLEYDVPIYIYNNHDKDNAKIVIGYMGVTLTKVEDNNTIVELDQGSRKMTNYEGRSSANSNDFMGVSIGGKAVDQVSNTGNTGKKVLYKLYGYVEKGYYEQIDKDIYFCNANGEIESLGIGLFNIAVYEKVNVGIK